MLSFRHVCVMAFSGVLFLSVEVNAADSTEATSAAASSGVSAAPTDEMSEIVVTAQRRSGNLETTPVAIAVISADQLASQGIHTESDLTFAAPGLTIEGSTSSNQINYVVRGQATDPDSSTRPGVLPYFNEVQVSGPGGSTAFYDLQSVQVLKGPQGTLFGRNSAGGAVLFTTAKPTDSLEGFIDVSGGNYDYRRVEGALSIPIISDTVLARIAGFVEKRDGFQYNEFYDHRVGDTDRYGLRGSITVKPRDGIENETVVDFFSAHEGSIAAELYAIDPTAPTPAPAALLFSPFLDTILQFPGAFKTYLAAHPGANPGGIPGALATQQSLGLYTIDSSAPNSYTANNLVVSNITTIDAGAVGQIKNIAGYAHLKNLRGFDAFSLPFTVDGQQITGSNEQLSDELQLLGKVFDDKLSYTTGVFFSRETADNTFASSLLELEPFIPVTQQNNAFNDYSKTYAAYAQGTYDLSATTGLKGLGATLGARYTDEKVGLQIRPDDSSYASIVADPTKESPFQEKSYRNVSWTAGLQEQLNDHVLLYVTSRRAYRNGGYNGLIRPVVGDGSDGGDSYKTEKVTDAEAGIKFQGHLGAVPARLNVDGYHTWIMNDQRVAFTFDSFGNPAAITVNVPKARVSGAEFDGEVRPLGWLTIGGSANYTDGGFTDNKVSILGRPPTVFGTFPYASRFSGAVYAQLTFPVQATIDLIVRGEEYDQSSLYFTSTGNLNPGGQVPGYAITNLRVGLESSKNGWSVSANVKNAFNRAYYTGGVDTAQLFQLSAALPGTPRTAWLDVRYKF